MERELVSTIKVTLWVAASMSYARFASARLNPGGARLAALSPVLCLLLYLPCTFSSVNLRGASGFFLAWLGLFKIILLSFGVGPLHPHLPLPTFIALASLPVNLTAKPKLTAAAHGWRLAAKAALFAALLSVYHRRHQLHPHLLLLVYCGYIYLSLELLLADAAALAAVLGLGLEPQMNAPYRAASFQDFWGRRWNLMVTTILRPVVYDPVKRRWGAEAGVMAAFLVSGLMHELMFWYLTSAWPTGEAAGFFVLHGVCTAAEAAARRRGWWRQPPAVVLAAAAGFFAVTLVWLFFPPLVRNGTDEKATREFIELVALLGSVVR